MVDFEHADPEAIPRADDLTGIRDKAICELRHVDQAILVDSDIDEGAEVGHVGDHTLEPHPLLEVGEFPDILSELGRLKGLSGISAGFLELSGNVSERR